MRINDNLDLLENHQLQLSVAWGEVLFYLPQLSKDLKNLEIIPKKISWSERLFAPKIDYSVIPYSEIQNNYQSFFSFAEENTLSLYKHSLIQSLSPEDFLEKLPGLKDYLNNFLESLQIHWSSLSLQISQNFENCLNSHPESLEKLSLQLETSLNTLEILQNAIRVISLSIRFLNELIEGELRILRVSYV